MAGGFFGWVLRVSGWKATHLPPPGLDKFVLIIAPHTSMWDFVWGRLILSSMHLRVKFLIKKEIFWFPLGLLLKALGGLPVDRTHGNQMIHQVVEAYERSTKLVVVITPEGTRKRIRHWKKGFYRIAKSAGVPVAVGYLDYSTRTYGIVYNFMPSGDFEKDCESMVRFYSDKTGKHAERFEVPDWKS